MTKKSPYSILAKYYDDFAGTKRYAEWQLFLKEIINKYQIDKDFAIDLACGTGTNSKTLKKLGFSKVFGIDKSQSMLDQAKLKYKDISFFKKDFLNFYGKKFEEASLVTCFYDSLNYLLEEAELEKVLINVYRSLKKGGIFLFDLNTPGHVKGIAGNQPALFTKDDLSVRMENNCRGDFWFLDLSISTKNKENVFTERHIEKAYSEKIVKTLIKRSGFKLLELKKEQKTYQDGKNYNNRIYYIVKK